MLSEEDKKRIEVVETHKFEIRDKLEIEKYKKFGIRMVFSFFNSKFGLWLLSAVFFSGGVKIYDDYKVKQENQKYRGEIIEKLDSEIAYKLNKVLVVLEQMQEKEAGGVLGKEFSTFEEAKNFVLGIKKTSTKDERYLYEEYKYWGMMTLMEELNRQYKHLGISDPELEAVIRRLNELSSLYENKEVIYEDIIAIQKIFREELLLTRWRS